MAVGLYVNTGEIFFHIPNHELTERELEILNLIARGDNNNTIANKLSLSIKTVPNYVSSILTKLQVADRAQAIVRAREAGFGTGK